MIQDEKFDQDILGKIKDKHKPPKARWKFLLKEYTIWGLGVVSVMVGALAISVMIYLVANDDWQIYHKVSRNIWHFIILSLPYFWLVLLAIFVAASFYYIKHTRKGYRYSVLMVVAFSIISSIVTGSIFYFFGLGQAIDDVLGQRAPFYERFFNPRMGFWSDAENGRLTGLVLSVTGRRILILADPARAEWNVDISKAESKFGAMPEAGKPIRLLGRKTGERQFEAKDILPMNKPGKSFIMRMNKNRQMLPPPAPGDTSNIPPHINDLNGNKGSACWMMEKYPELKTAFEKGIIQDKENIKKIIKNDPKFLEKIESLDLDPKVFEELKN